MEFLIATTNKGKLEEFSRMLKPLGISAVAPSQIGIKLNKVDENQLTFQGNAYLKAYEAFKQTGIPSIADDSGLEVKALNGAPGVRSARFGTPIAVTDSDRNMLLLEKLKDVNQSQRDARFVCAICVVFDDKEKLFVKGKCYGKIAFEEKGEHGFGYDPLFALKDGRTFAQLNEDEKDKISHRGIALRKLSKALKEYI